MRFTLATSIVALAVLTAAAPRPGQSGGIAIPISKRSTLVNGDKSVNIDALKSHVASVKAKVLRGVENFKRNTGAVKGIQKRATGANALTNSNNELWYGTISVGTPAVEFTVDFDTGSSDLFLPGPSCGSSCDGHTLYDPSASSTSQDLGRTFELHFGPGSTVSGEEYTDTVTVAGLTAVNQTLGVASEYSTDFQASQFPADGLLGLAFESLSAYNATPFFQNLVYQGQTDEPVFSFKLASSGSELFLGGANSALYIGNFTYAPVTKEGFWQVSMDGISVNGNVVIGSAESIIDTGSTQIIGDSQSVQALYDQIPGSKQVDSGFWSVPCDFNTPLSITFGGTEFPISPSTFNLGQVSSGSSDCIGGFASEDGLGYWIIGDVFLQNVYTEFDVGNTRVGFANLA